MSGLEQILGTTLPVFIGLTVVLAGGAAFMTGQSSAAHWQPALRAVLFAALLGAADRFLVYALFDGPLLSLSGYLSNTAVLVAIALFGYRVTQARKMVSQYPWLYRRAGLFGWRSHDA
jgi:hypothetical protein